MTETTTKDVIRAVTDVSFPANKDELLRVARSNDASPGVLAALREMPPEEYANRDEVARSVRTAPDADRPHSAAQRAEQARKGGKPGLSERLRDAERPPVEEELEN
ncbi:DUF2795 domain-containing protein [Streptomyces oceani]|uniref:DUF2795 domain-containing protein n=1 Tax=Streptomyces oceani TaxID=1075402 RepID=A0A1E7JY93_9ACTN|nr:DUF2795 domain-containing protein [Streptomyces oceani]OEU96629.1 hypothetical protein AN216_19410 [Streptomyces oceani]